MEKSIRSSRLRRAAFAAVDTLENRCLFAALVPSAPVLVFNSDVNSGGANHVSHTDTLTITNTGSTTLSGLGLAVALDPADSAGDQSADFHVTSGSFPASLAPSRPTTMPRTKFVPTAIIRICPSVSKPLGAIAMSVSIAKLHAAPIPIPQPPPIKKERMRFSPMLCLPQTMGTRMGTKGPHHFSHKICEFYAGRHPRHPAI